MHDHACWVGMPRQQIAVRNSNILYQPARSWAHPVMTAGIPAQAGGCQPWMSSLGAGAAAAAPRGGSAGASWALVLLPRLAQHVAAAFLPGSPQLPPRPTQPSSLPTALIKSSCPRKNRNRVSMLPLGAFPHQLFSAGESHKLSMNSLGSTLPQIFLSNVLTRFSSTVPASAATSGSKFHRAITT